MGDAAAASRALTPERPGAVFGVDAFAWPGWARESPPELTDDTVGECVLVAIGDDRHFLHSTTDAS